MTDSITTTLDQEDENQGYTITTKFESNDEGSNFAEVTITFADGTVDTTGFAQWIDSGPGVPSAAAQAFSFIDAFEESMTTTLEERLEREFEREMSRSDAVAWDSDDLPF